MTDAAGRVWFNDSRDQSCTPLAIRTPSSLDDLIELVRGAEQDGTTVHAVGSGHAWSEAALTDGVMALPDGLRGLLDLDDGTLRAQLRDERHLVRVKSGTPLRELNDALDAAGLALANMGGYDAQTIAGVVSTSTHGSGLHWGSFPSIVRSLDVVIARGEVVRVEPADGPTDAGAFERVFAGARRLIQDDDTFAAAVCGIGLMGLIYSLVITVRDRFWLQEVRTLDTWENVRAHLRAGGVLDQTDKDARPLHYELFVNPYADHRGLHQLLVTRRSECPDPAGLPPDQRERHPLTELLSGLPRVWGLLRWLGRHLPRAVVLLFNRTLKGMCDDSYANVSYRVFNIGQANHLPGYSMELAISLQDDRHIEAVDRILQIAAERRAKNHWYHTSPFALRFVAPSDAYASMMYERQTMMIELIMILGTPHGHELLAGYEKELADLGVRAHWGQYNTLTAARVAADYPQWNAWLAVHREFNSTGVFTTELATRLGITAPAATA